VENMATNTEKAIAGQKHKILVVDPRKCTGCEICESVCSFAHDGEFNPLNSRINRVRLEPIINTSINCQSCYEPDCIDACQINALSKNPVDGTINVDYNICDGCGACIRQCPFGAIVLHTKERKAIVCDMCVNHEEGIPQCIEFCPKEAIFIAEIDPNLNEDRLVTITKILDDNKMNSVFDKEQMLN
jgi:anaerobic carbon-monoxide dehydrogenase iron sulfur subunit